MKKSDFNEDRIEELLSQMPKIQDNQDADSLFEKINSQLEEEERIPEKKTVRWFDKKYTIPAVLSVAAILFFALLVPSMSNQQNQMEMSMESHSANEEATFDKAEEELEMAPKSFDNGANTTEEFSIAGNEGSMGMLPPNDESRVITELPKGFGLMVLAVPDLQAQMVVPISFLYPETQYSVTEAFEQATQLLQEDEWGLSAFMLEQATIETEVTESGNERVVMNLQQNVAFEGSAMETIFLQTVQETFKRLGYEEIQFLTEGSPGIKLSHSGTLTEMKLIQDTKKPYYKHQGITGASPVFLVPGISVDTIQEAFNSMKVGIETYGLMPSIPAGIDFTIQTDQNHVIVQFTEQSQLNNNPEHQWMLEAMLLTVKEFGFETVTFEHPNHHIVGPYSLNEEMNVPIAPNPMPFNR